MNESIYVLITTPYTDFEKELANDGLAFDALKCTKLKISDLVNDFVCNKPFALYSMCNAFYKRL